MNNYLSRAELDEISEGLIKVSITENGVMGMDRNTIAIGIDHVNQKNAVGDEG